MAHLVASDSPVPKLLPPSSDSAMPKYLLPPYPTSPKAKWLVAKARLMSVVDQLEACDYGHENVLMLANLGFSILLSEEYHRSFFNLGMEISEDLYSDATINAEYEQIQNDPNNPSNWPEPHWGNC